jgi:hypothetical protein
VALDRKPERVSLAPLGAPLGFEWREGRMYFTVPEVCRHTLVVLE